MLNISLLLKKPPYLNPMIIPQETQQQIQLLLSQNNKIQAVALVKQATNCSLREAKDYVDQLDQPKIKMPFKENIDDQLRTLLTKGKKIEAIKIYKDHSGVSLADSKNYVESLEQYSTKNSTSSIDRLLQEQPKPKPNYTWTIILLIAAAIITWALLRK